LSEDGLRRTEDKASKCRIVQRNAGRSPSPWARHLTGLPLPLSG